MPDSIIEYLQRGPATSKDIQRNTEQSQTTVARKLRELGERVVSIKQGKSPLYALTRNAFGCDDKLHLTMVDPNGGVTSVGNLRPLEPEGYLVQTNIGASALLLGEDGTGWYDDLPYFLYDIRPQGFIGRQIAKQLAAQSDDFPKDPRVWTSDHIGRFLVTNGDDLPGNVRLGPQAIYRLMREPSVISRAAYPDIANSIVSGGLPGSSAGGEQLKFAAYCSDCSAHVIVKFSPRGDRELTQRWKDILVTEYYAAEILHGYGLPVAKNRLLTFEGDDRLFLESVRFDRTGKFGRHSMISLEAIDNEFTGVMPGEWPEAVDALYRKKLVGWDSVNDATALWSFGRLINNSDMHFGNLSFRMERNGFRLLPCYDMCSMGFAPISGGELPAYDFTQPALSRLKIEDEFRVELLQMAHLFWERVYGDERISDELRAFLEKGNPIDISTSS